MDEKIIVGHVTARRLAEIAGKVRNMDRANEIRTEYGGSEQIIGPNMHRRIVGSAGKFLKWIVEHGATREEVRKAEEWLYVCVDAVKYRLDIDRYRQENGILALMRKYNYAPAQRRSEPKWNGTGMI